RVGDGAARVAGRRDQDRHAPSRSSKGAVHEPRHRSGSYVLERGGGAVEQLEYEARAGQLDHGEREVEGLTEHLMNVARIELEETRKDRGCDVGRGSCR